MSFSIPKTIAILERTPNVLSSMLYNLSADWVQCNEGPETWSVFDIIGHLIQGEKTDWMTRTKIILSDKTDKNFEAFDRFAQFKTSQGKSINDLILEFASLREANLEELKSLEIRESDLNMTGNHPAFGAVSLRQVLATWVAHDLSHIAQISRVMAKHYKEDIGPFVQYLRIMS
ncbi:DinB family protein [Daejeonella sp.]|uniref:DinB family protein n=1 Tax=Daejeonella sp. TaxID=2805397 RepID=UPI00271AF2AA|nr:DinB family protein [Daejeonella sp.]MDO8991483.1 DinB family protein [Daejeonella sp.]MDP2415020.1 DinB family protein [Daejeonella sp.]